MASIKELKKDIDFLTYEVIEDCFIYVLLNPGKKEDEANKIIDDIIDVRSELISRMRNYDVSKNKSVKAYYKTIQNDLLAKVDESFEKISALTK